MIKTILVSKTHNPHYLTKYITFINNCQEKNKNYKGYIERHHICPKAQDMFPEFASFSEFPWNCAKLTPRQHFIAHLILYKAYPEVVSQKQALFLMSHTKGLKISSGIYAKLRLEVSESKKGTITVKNINGDTLRVSTTDSRYLSGELVGVAKGTVVVKDLLGEAFSVCTTDSRYLEGQLVHVATGTISKDRGFSAEQILEIRAAIKCPTAVITLEFIANHVKATQRDKINSIPFNQLKFKNGAYMSYNSLLATYYAIKYSVTKAAIIKVIYNKSYKEISV